MADGSKALANPKANENWRAYERARDAGHVEYIDMAKKCDRFYIGGGEQWEDTDRQKLAQDGRPALEINMILSTVNALIGEQSSSRADITFKPRNRANDDTASVLTQLALQIQDNNMYEFVESQVFADGVIQDRGYFDVRIDFTDHIQGEVRITAEDPLTILPDPTAKDYDPKTWKEVTKTKWMTLDDIAIQYGKEKGDELKNYIYAVDTTFGLDSIRFEEQTYGDNTGFYSNSDIEKDKKLKRARVIERQHRKLSMVRFFVDPINGDMRQIPDNWSEAKVNRIKEKAGVYITNKVVSRIRWTASIDGFLLHDDWSPYKDFTIVPFFPYFRRGRPFGVVRNLISPQEQLNKIESQELHIVNTTANSGWIVEAGSLTNMTEDELETRGAETGLVMVYGRNRQAPEKISANNIPTGIDRMASKSVENIRNISGIGEGMLDISAPEVSGVALRQKQSRGMIQLQVPFDNLNRSRRFVAQRILDLIQQFYTETRVFQVLDFRDPNQESQEIIINGINAAGEVINDVTLGEYDVVVSSTPARDSFVDTQFAEALSLRDAGVAIPDDVVIENSNLERKKEIAKRVRSMQGMEPPTEEEAAILQYQQEMAMKEMELSLQEMQAKIQKLNSEAMLSSAKAEKEGSSTEFEQQKFGAELQLEIQKLQQKWAEHMSNLKNKMDLAGLHASNNQQITQYTTASKRATQELQMRYDNINKGLDRQAQMLQNVQKQREGLDKKAP